MDRNKEKPDMVYTIQSTVAPGAQVPASVPYIVDTKSVDLVDVINQAITNGYVTDLKPEAVNGLAEGICEGIWYELSQGRGVKLGDYLRMQLYLDGPCNSNGDLTEENTLNVRFINGPEFKLDIGDFSWHYAGAGENPTIDLVVPDASTMRGDDGTKGYLILGKLGHVMGKRLTKTGAMTSVIVCKLDGETVAEVDTFTKSSEGHLTFEVAADFVETPGEYVMYVERVEVSPDGESKINRSTGRKVVFAAA